MKDGRHTYPEKIAIKQAVRQRDGMRCTRCGMTNEAHRRSRGTSLHVHRLQPGSLYSLDGCVTLCGNCHRSAHKRRQSEPDLEKSHEILSLPFALHQAMKRLAQRNGRTLTREVEVAILAYLKRSEMPPPEDPVKQ